MNNSTSKCLAAKNYLLRQTHARVVVPIRIRLQRRWTGRLGRPAEMLAHQRLSLLRNLKSVGVQVQKYRFGDMRALFGRDPVIVQIRTAITLGIFDKSRMNGVRNQFFYGVSRHIASCFTPRHSTARDRSATVGPW